MLTILSSVIIGYVLGLLTIVANKMHRNDIAQNDLQRSQYLLNSVVSWQSVDSPPGEYMTVLLVIDDEPSPLVIAAYRCGLDWFDLKGSFIEGNKLAWGHFPAYGESYGTNNGEHRPTTG